MGKQELFDMLRNLQKDGRSPDLTAINEILEGVVLCGGQPAVRDHLEEILRGRGMPEGEELLSLIKKMTSGLSCEERRDLGDFIDRATRKLGYDELSGTFLKMLDEIAED